MTSDVFLYRLLGALPLLLIWLGGIGWCVLNYSHQPRRSRLAMIALVTLLVSQVTIPFLQEFFLNQVFDDQLAFAWRVVMGSMIDSLPRAIACGLLIWAAVGSAAGKTVESSSSNPES